MVVAFQRPAPNPQAARAALLDSVVAAGSIEASPRDYALRDAAAALHLMGFVHIEELTPCGTGRRLTAHEARLASPLLTWRVAARHRL